MLGLMLALGLCACGNDDVKVITKDGVETGAENEKEDTASSEPEGINLRDERSSRYIT